jgi:hypothetical protein
LNSPDYENYADGKAIAIHKRWPYHIAHRTKVINRCKKLLFKV